MRIHDAANKYNLSTDDVIELLRRAGFDVNTQTVALTYDMVEMVERFTKPRKSKIKTKKRAAKKAKAKAAPAPKVKVKVRAKAKAKAKTVKKKAAAKAETAKATTKKTTVDAREKPIVVKKTEVAAKQKATTKEATVKAKATTTKPKAAEPPATKVVKKTVAKKEKAVAEAVAKKVAAAVPKKRPTPPPAAAKPRVKEAPRPPKKKTRRDSAASDAQQKAVRESVRRTLAKVEPTRRTKRHKSKPRAFVSTEARPVRITEGMTVREAALAFKVEPQDIVERSLELGAAATINEALDKDMLEFLAEDLGVAVQFVSDEIEDLLKVEVPVDTARLEARAPVVTVMGHVDHGKTSILDYIRKAKVVSGEAGGITQHIGAYEVDTPNGKVTFIDTPGHEAFTSMRARGARVTDIVVLVVAADDGVMPQTIEAIDHAKAAEVPLIVAINKMDLPAANPAQIKQQLTEHGVVVEEFGGDVVSVDLSAKTGEGIDRLLEMILLQSELMELMADRNATAQGVAIEVRKEEERGILCTVLVTQGTLRVGDAAPDITVWELDGTTSHALGDRFRTKPVAIVFGSFT